MILCRLAQRASQLDRRAALVIGLALSVAGCAGSPVAGNKAVRGDELTVLLDDIVAWEDTRSPLAALYRGKHPTSIQPVQLANFARDAAAAQSFLNRLDQSQRVPLDQAGQISAAVARFKLTDIIDRHEFGEHLIPLNAEGGFYNAASVASGRLPFATLADYEAWLAWLPQYAAYLTSHLPLLQEAVRQSRLPPRLVIDNNLQMLRRLVQAKFARHTDLTPLQQMPGSIEADQQERLRQAGKRILAESLRPAYIALHDYLASSYRSAAPEAPGLAVQPGGREHYANRVRFFTTLDLTPEQVFALGEREVQRIEAAMDAVLRDLEFAGSREEFIAQLRTAKEHYPQSAQALLERAAFLSKRIEGRLPNWFEPLYRLPFTVEPVPAAIAPTYTSGRYVAGNAEQGLPGIYWVNTTKLRSRALFNLAALTLHEAVPGHHLQHALAAEQQAVHPLQQNYYISAFGEGWGLYAEYLGEEMGIYTTAHERFGRLGYEMWRACRLVVDVGLHYRGWSRARAIDYLGSRTTLSDHEVVTEIDRYIGWPGQALAYKLGELTIKGLRAQAEQELGVAFDIKAFHAAVLSNGSVPLPVLIEQVQATLGLTGAMPAL